MSSKFAARSFSRNRFYSPDTGRFISSDPLGMVDGPNTYGFCGGDPVNRSDPMGTIWRFIRGGKSRPHWEWRRELPGETDTPNPSFPTLEDAFREHAITLGGLTDPNNPIDLTAEQTFAIIQSTDDIKWVTPQNMSDALKRDARAAYPNDKNALTKYAREVNYDNAINVLKLRSPHVADAIYMFKDAVLALSPHMFLISKGHGAVTGYDFFTRGKVDQTEELAGFLTYLVMMKGSEWALNRVQIIGKGMQAGASQAEREAAQQALADYYRVRYGGAARPPAVPGPRTLTAAEVREVQAIAEEFNTNIYVGGSRGRGAGLNIETNNPVGGPKSDPTRRSDIDFIYDKSHPRADELMRRLMRVGRGAGGGHIENNELYSNPSVPDYDENFWRILFEPNKPVTVYPTDPKG